MVEALELAFPNDPTKSVEDLGRHKKSLQGIFRINSADYSSYTGAALKIRDLEIPFTPWRRTPNTNSQWGPSYGRREGTLITIYGAFRLEYQEIDKIRWDKNESFLGQSYINLQNTKTTTKNPRTTPKNNKETQDTETLNMKLLYN